MSLSFLFFSCPNTLGSGSHYTEDRVNTQRPVFASPELQERMLFNEKRRKRAIVYNLLTCTNLNDFDRDGVVNSEDPFPFDYKYPGIQIISDNSGFKLPLTVSSSDWGSRFSLKFRSTADFILKNKIASVGTLTIDRDIFDGSNIDSMFNYFSKHKGYFDYKEYYKGSSFFYNSSTRTYTLNKYNTKIEDWNLSSYGFGASGDYKINLITLKGLEELSYTPNYSTDYSFSGLTDFPKESFSIFNRVSTEFKNYQENNHDLSTTICNLYELLTGEETDDPYSIEDLISWGREAFLTLESSEYIDELGLSDNNWRLFGYDTYAFSSFGIGNDFMEYRYPTNEGRWNLMDGEISCVGIDNIITHTKGVRYSDTECSFKFDTYNNKLNDMIAIKVVVERDFQAAYYNYDSSTNGGNSRLRIFISTPQGIRKKIPVGAISSKWLNILRNEDAGFRTTGNSIVYNMEDDQGLFPQMVYEQLGGSGGTKLNTEYMSFFFFLIPKEISYYSSTFNKYYTYTEWLFLGSSIHTWPTRSRSTVIAKLDQNDDVIDGPYILPYDYVVNPENFTAEYSGTLYEAARGIILWDIFNIDANAGEKVLFMSAMQLVDFYGKAPKVKTDEVFFIKDPIKSSNVRYPLDVTQIYLSNISVNSKNTVLRSIMSQLSYNAYKISIDNSIIGETLSGALCVRPDGLFSSHLDGEPEPNHLVMMSVTGFNINELICDIDLNNSSHWIPNTNETLGNFKVKFSAKLSNNETAILKNKEIILTSPEDPNFAVKDPGTCNINRNKGTGLVVYAVGENDQLFHLANFDKNFPDGKSASENKPYHVSYNSFYFNVSTGLGKNGYKLKTDIDGNMAFYHGDSSTTNFTVKALSGTDGIRPGDDFMLKFAANSNGTLVTATAPEGDFFAVYDKKMLWRANLYVDEGVSDWNNTHPWISGNNWYVSAEDGADVAGGQIDIQEWTRVSGDNVTNSIPYTWGGSDTIETVKWKLEYQKASITAKYSSGNPEWTESNVNPHPDWSPWTLTIAPENSWSNYIFAGDMDLGNSYATLTINTNDYYPYLPNFSTYRESYLDNYSWEHVLYSIGIDCSGFVQRAASYTGNYYIASNFRDGESGRDEWTVGRDVHLRHGTAGLIADDRSWQIAPQEQVINFDKIVPGDIIIKDGHVMLVQEITYDNGTRNVADRTKITVIHSRQGVDDEWSVDNNEEWDDSTYQVRRLR